MCDFRKLTKRSFLVFAELSDATLITEPLVDDISEMLSADPPTADSVGNGCPILPNVEIWWQKKPQKIFNNQTLAESRHASCFSWLKLFVFHFVSEDSYAMMSSPSFVIVIVACCSTVSQ